MATLGEIRTRIITQTNRDDLADDLATTLDLAISDAIEFYAAERFWWTESRVTSNCVIGNEYIAYPTGARFTDAPYLVVGGVRYPLRKCDMSDLEALYTTPISGRPTDWAMFGSNARLWPTPNLAYQVIWLNVADVTGLDYTSAASTNSWTLNAPTLIIARAKIILYRDYLSAMETDPRLALAINQEAEAYARLKGETNRRISTGRLQPHGC